MVTDYLNSTTLGRGANSEPLVEADQVHPRREFRPVEGCGVVPGWKGLVQQGTHAPSHQVEHIQPDMPRSRKGNG